MTAPGPIEERGLVDHIGAGGHRRDGLRGRSPQLVPAILDRPVEVDLDRGPAVGLEVGQKSRLVLESAPADDVELRVVAHRPLHEIGQRGAFELGQVLAREVRDQVRGGEHRSSIDQLHPATIVGGRVTLPVMTMGYARGMSGIGRDPEQPDPARPSRERVRETLVERQIREAIEDGAFDRLPHQGARLPLDDNSAAGDWALAHRILRNAGAAPPWIESDKAARAMVDELVRLFARAPRLDEHGLARARDEVARIVTAANAAIARLNAEAPTSRQHRRPLDLTAQLDRLARAARGEDADAASG